jgi:hypothetical protein
VQLHELEQFYAGEETLNRSKDEPEKERCLKKTRWLKHEEMQLAWISETILEGLIKRVLCKPSRNLTA